MKNRETWTNVADSQTPHMVFIGRFCPLHKGHVHIIEKKVEENPDVPVLIFVRDTAFDKYDAQFRKTMVSTWMHAKRISGTVMIIPDIDGVYWGRGVGYKTEQVEVTDEIAGISATEIRTLIANNDDSWRDLMACEEVADMMELKLRQ